MRRTIPSNRVVSEVDKKASRSFIAVKIQRHRFVDLRLQIAKVFSLRADAAQARRRVPGGNEQPRILVPQHLKSDFFHSLH
jgi:hypothetical protein